MSRSTALSAGSVLLLAVVTTAFWLGVRQGSSGRPDLGIAPADTVRILEEEPYLVPAGRELVITAVGTRLATITEIGLGVDGESRCSVQGDGAPDARHAVHAVATAGQRVRVWGGLVEDDALALGYLMSAEGLPRARDRGPTVR